MAVPNQKEVGAGAVYNAFYEQLKADTKLIEYCDAEWMFAEYNQAVSSYPYFIFIEPAQEQPGKYTNGLLVGAQMTLSVYCGMQSPDDLSGKIYTGLSDGKPGLMQFVRDVRQAIEADISLGISRFGSSLGQALSGGQGLLTASARYLTIKLNDSRTPPSGYTLIDCGSSTLAGAAIAENIQTALQALGNGGNTYDNAVCTYDSTTRKLKVETRRTGARGSVQITAGENNSALAVLGFDKPTESRGRDVKVAALNNVLYESRDFPTRWAVLQFQIDYEDWIRN